MSISVGNKYIAIKDVWFFHKADVVEVVDISDYDIVTFTSEEDDAKYFMDSTTFKNHFARITPETEAPKVSYDQIVEILEASEFDVYTAFDKCTIVSCKLPNGFVITESSACVSPENYDEEIGIDICIDNITRKLYELEGYRLQEEMYRDSIMDMMEGCPFGCEDCSECPCDKNCEYEIDECLDTDLDCDDCKDFGCSFNPNNPNK